MTDFRARRRELPLLQAFYSLEGAAKAEARSGSDRTKQLEGRAANDFEIPEI
jgi:hypothetical protein